MFLQHFVKGVIKLQRRMEADLTEEEEEAVACLLADTTDDDDLEEPTANAESPKSFAESLKESQMKLDQACNFKSRYSPAVDTVEGSAALVESFWSSADSTYTKRRSSMSPLVFECIMYLRYNARLWGLADVVEANKRRKNESSKAKKALRARASEITGAIEEWDTANAGENEE